MAEKCMDESKESPKDEAMHPKGFLKKAMKMKLGKPSAEAYRKEKGGGKMKAKGMKR